MKIQLDSPSADRNMIQSYSPAGIIINNVLYQHSLIISPEHIFENWSADSPAMLLPSHFIPVIEQQPELVLIGTGKRLQFPDQEILALIMGKNIGVEVMDTAAACRAYNFIAGEGRKVIATLININSD